MRINLHFTTENNAEPVTAIVANEQDMLGLPTILLDSRVTSMQVEIIDFDFLDIRNRSDDAEAVMSIFRMLKNTSVRVYEVSALYNGEAVSGGLSAAIQRIVSVRYGDWEERVMDAAYIIHAGLDAGRHEVAATGLHATLRDIGVTANVADVKRLVRTTVPPLPEPFDPRTLAKSYVAARAAKLLSQNAAYQDVGVVNIMPFGNDWLLFNNGLWKVESKRRLTGFFTKHVARISDQIRLKPKKEITTIISSMETYLLGEKILSEEVELLPTYLNEDNTTEERNWLTIGGRIVDMEYISRSFDMPLEDAVSAASMPITSRWISQTRLPVEIDTEATCPHWLQYLEEALPGEHAEQIPVLQEFFGYCLVSYRKFKSCLFVTGNSDCGKSVTGYVLRKLIGDDNVSTVPIKDIGEEFGLQPMLGAKVNIQDEMEKYEKPKTGVFKDLIDGAAPITVNIKHRNKVLMRKPPKLFFICNNLPYIEDNSNGTWNRILLASFPRVFAEHEKIKNLEVEIADTELPGILNWALEGLRRLFRVGHFTQVELMEAEKARYRATCDQVRLWFNESNLSLEVNPKYAIFKTVCWENYKAWAASEEIKSPLNKNHFYESVLKMDGVSEGKIQGSHRCFVGIGVPDNYFNRKAFSAEVAENGTLRAVSG